MLKAESKGIGATLLPHARTLALLLASVGHISHPGTGTPVLEISLQPQAYITVFCKPAKLAAEPRTSLGRNKSKTTEISQRKFLGLEAIASFRETFLLYLL